MAAAAERGVAMQLGPEEELPEELNVFLQAWGQLCGSRPWAGARIPWGAAEQYREAAGIPRETDFVEVLLQLDARYLEEAARRDGQS